MMQNGRYSKCVVSYASQHMIRVFDCADLDIYFFRSSAHLISSKLFHGNNDNIYVQRNILLSIILHTKHISQLRLRTHAAYTICFSGYVYSFAWHILVCMQSCMHTHPNGKQSQSLSTLALIKSSFVL